MKKETLATGGVIGVSFLIASCCLAPTLALLFGVSVGALGSFSALEPYRPYFIAAGAIALLYAGRRIYRSAPPDEGDACEDGICAPDSGRRRITRVLFPFAVVLFVLACTYPYILNAILD